METKKEQARNCRQAMPRPYPMMGMETPHRETNAHRLYRYSDACLWCRYIIPPADEIDRRRRMEGRKPLSDKAYDLFAPGFTVGDLTMALAVAAFMVLAGMAVGNTLDAEMARAGW